MRVSLLSLAIVGAALPLALSTFGGCASSRSERAQTTSRAALSGGEAIAWSNVVNAIANGGTLTKTGGQPQMEDAGATSRQAIVSGDGGFDFTVADTSAFRFVGLSHAAGRVGGAAIDFELRLQAGHADVYEDGVYVADDTVQAGDRVGVAIEGGVVRYVKNGVAVHTSAKRPTYPLIVDASLIDAGAAITDARVYGSTAHNVDWTNVVHATAAGSTLTKTGGQPQMEDAGATSAEPLASGDGFLQFTMSETSTFRFLGLAHASSWVGGAGIDYAFRMQAGHADVYERGAWKADATAQPGDVLAIRVSGGVARYFKNGSLLYSSAQPVTYPLFADASLIDAGATVQNVVLGSGAGDTDAGSDADAGGGGATTGRFAGWLMAAADHANPDDDTNYRLFYANAARYLDEVSPTWWSVPYAGPKWNCCADTTQPFCSTYGNPKAVAACRIPSFATGHGATKVVPMFSNDKDAEAIAKVQAMVSDPAPTVSWIASQVEAGGYDGVNIDFEHMCDAYSPPQVCPYRDRLTSFMQALAARLHAMTPPRTAKIAIGALTEVAPWSEWDVAALGPIVDGLYVMGYDYHFVDGTTGPVDPIGWAQASIDYFAKTLSAADRKKVLWGLPNYGLYSSAVDGGADGFGTLAEMIAAFPGYTSTPPYAKDDNGYDMGLVPNGFNANNAEGRRYGFFDDVASLEPKVSYAARAGLGGVTYWTIGGEPNAPAGRSFFDMVRGHFAKR